jgi:lipoprotein-releasing system permease protein
MKRRSWIGFVSLRWFATKSESGGSLSAILAASGIAIGVTALVLVIGVMNGFQLGYIDSVLEVSSFHVRVTDARKIGSSLSSTPDGTLISRIAAQPGVASVLPFAETRCLISSRDGRASPLALRAVPDDAQDLDPGMMKTLGFAKEGGVSIWPGNGGLFLGAELAHYLGIVPGDVVDLLVVSSGGGEGVEARTVPIRVDGLFRSEYFDFDFGMAFMPFSAALPLFPSGSEQDFTYGVKLKDRYSDGRFAARISSELGLGPERAESWRDYNRAFFGALRIEKTVMMLLIGLIFLVVGVNIFHSMRRAVAEKTEDISVLKAMGASPEEIGRVFMLDGLAIGAVGAFVGLALGLLLAMNVNEVFAIVESVVNFLASMASRIAGGLGGDEFRFFSPQYFYLMEVPVRVLYPETFFVTAAAIAAAVTAAAAAARRISGLAPAEVLRYE